MKRSQRTGYRWMALLMACSQLLLTGFVIYWLNGQYRNEQVNLHSQLNHEYQSVGEQLLDSMLMVKLILPSLDDSLMVEVLLQHESPQFIQTNEPVLMKKHFTNIPHDSVLQSAINVEVVMAEERMVRGVKLFINENEEVFQGEPGVHVFAMNLDSVALLSQMETILEVKEWNFSLEWPSPDSGIKVATEIPGLVLNGAPSGHLPALEVKHVSGFIILSVLPQILFGMILLLLSASALLFARRMLKKQIALHQLRDDFIGNISHELKTPVSTVKIALEALGKYDFNKDPERSGEYLEMASIELERLEQLVGKVLHHDMLRNPSLLMKREDHELGLIVKKVLRTLQIPISENHAEVSVFSTEPGCIVNVDSLYMEGVILNLIDNCLKYAGPEPKIKLEILCTHSHSTLSVRDHGPGIPEEYRKQIFEKFFRIPFGDKHDVKGYGLGLNFASQVMSHHGGSISQKNHPEKGAIFTLHFPNNKE